jgi:hypothetical protein
VATPSHDPALQSDLDLAAQLVTEAGKLALTMRQGVLVVDRKTSISDVVSDADKAAEAMIVERLAELRPDDGLIGEEGAARAGQRKWIIDPVDGTYNFVSGLPEWCSALALVDGDELVLGAVYQATSDELWLGGPTVPTTLNGRPVAPRPTCTPRGCPGRSFSSRCCAASPGPRRCGCSGPDRWSSPRSPERGSGCGCTPTRCRGTGSPGRRWCRASVG